MNNAGFLICFENSSLACIIQNRKSVKTNQTIKYFLLAADEMKLPDSCTVVDLEETEYT